MKNTEISKNKTESVNKKVMLVQRIVAVAFVVGFVTAFIVCYIKYGKQLYNVLCNTENLKQFMARFNGYDQWIFVGIRALQTVVKIIPAEPLEIGSGALYGTWGGLFYCLLGTEIGSLLILLITRIFGRKAVEIFVPMEKINSLRFLQNEKRVYLALFIIYLIPGTPKDVITYLAGITEIKKPAFLLITGFARIPSIITSTICGEQLMRKNYTAAIIVFTATAVVGLIAALLYKKYSDKKNKTDEGETNS